MNAIPGRNDPCWCGSGRKYKACHMHTDNRIALAAAQGHEVPTRAMLKTPAQLEGIRRSARINVAVLDEIARVIRPGMTTGEIDRIVRSKTEEMGGVPAPLGYKGYPYSVCTSVNDQVCHGFPLDSVVLKEGDIVNVDCSTILDGYYSDSSRMFIIGEATPERKRLVEVARECVEKGLAQVKPWGFLGDMAQAVNDHAKANGCSVVKEIGGHGVGIEFHEDPWVGYTGEAGTGMLMVPGMVFTIEPMVNLGTADVVTHIENDWEIFTEDGQPSAQWELMVLVTEDGYEVLSW